MEKGGRGLAVEEEMIAAYFNLKLVAPGTYSRRS